VVALAGSNRLVRAAQGIAVELRLVLAFTDRSPGRAEKAVAEHQRLIDQLRTAAPRQVRAALRDHLDAAERLVCANLG
jgi:DNA-binding GntR family transcriptional regulator